MKGNNLRNCALAVMILLLQSTLLAQTFNIPPNFSGRPNSATALGNNCWRLTPNTANVSGAVWSNTPLNLANPFDITLHTWINPWGADGMAFVLQTLGTGYVGHGGNAMGFANNINTTQPGISPSFAVELDTWDNSTSSINDLAVDHLAIVRNGVHATPIFGPVQARANGADVTDGVCRQWRMIWDPVTDNFRVLYDGVQIFNVTYDIPAQVFGGTTMVTWGFTAASGGVPSEHVVCFDFANAGPDTASCNGAPVQLGASGGTSYTWWNQIGTNLGFNNQNIGNPTYNPFIAPNPQTLRVTVLNSYGCTDRDTLQVFIDQPPSAANAGPPQSLCNTTTSTLAGNTPANGTGQWAVVSGGGSVTTPGAPNSGVTGLQVGINEFEWVISNTAACPPERDTVVVEVFPAPTPANAGPDQTVCSSDTAQLAANTPAIGVGAWSFVTGSGTLTNAADPAARLSGFPGAGTVSLLWSITNGPCPAATDQVNITVAPDPTVLITSADPTSICLGDSFQIQVDTTGNTVPAWTPGVGLSSTNILEPFARPTVNTRYYLTVTDPVTTCSSMDSIDVVVNPLPTDGITSPDTFICNIDTVQLNVSTLDSDTWQWSPSSGLSSTTIANPMAFPTVSTDFEVLITNSTTGCSTRDTVTVNVFTLPLADFRDTTLCLGEFLDLEVEVGDLFLWTSTDPAVDGSTADSIRIMPTTAQDYSVFVIANFGGSSCADSASLHVEVNSVTATAAPDYTLINPGQSVDLTSSGDNGTASYAFSWMPITGLSCDTCSNPTATVGETTTYTVTVTDTAGCSDTYSVTVETQEFLVPNVFTPNGDGINDELFINYYGEMEYETHIYDRWGKLVFKTSDKQVHWNGKTMGSNANCQSGTYFMVLYILNDDTISEELKNKGFDITLIR